MRYLFGFICVLALGVMPMVGCSETTGDGGGGGMAGSGGSTGSGGNGGSGGTTGQRFPCNEQGILDAIAEGGGPHTFDCVGPTTVVLDEPIQVDNSVILDGGGNMALSGSFQGLFIVPADQSLEVRRFEISSSGSGILGEGTVKVVDSVFSGESGRGTGIEARGSLTVDSSTFSGGETGIAFGSGSLGELMVRDSTFSGNTFAGLSIYTGGSATLVGCTLSANGSGIVPDGFFGGGFALTLINSTISGSTGEAIRNIDDITLINSTIVENNDAFPAFDDVQTLKISNTVVAGECGDIAGTVTSSGYNIESPGNTCGLDQTGDQSDVTAEQLNLGPLANNGGPTMTHKPGDGGFGDGSAAIDQIPVADCGAATDQRGQPRPEAGGTMCDVGAVEVQVPFSCTEQGIRDAIAEGGGPHTFSCAGPQTVVTAAEIVIDNDVILDGEGNLIVDGNDDHIVFFVDEGATVELTGLVVTRGRSNGGPPLYRFGGCIMNLGTSTLTNCTVSRCTAAENPDPERYNEGGGIVNGGSLTLKNTTVSENSADFWGGGILNGGTLVLTNSTVSGNTVGESGGFGRRSGGGISNIGGTLTLTNSTISGNTAKEYTAVQNIHEGTLTVTGSVIDGTCGSETVVTSVGHNIESPGNTCGFDTNKGDQVNVSTEDLNLGPLQDNGGPTMTHALQTVPVVSAAIDQIPEADCGVTTDQRGVLRPQGPACDLGAFELEVAP